MSILLLYRCFTPENLTSRKSTPHWESTFLRMRICVQRYYCDTKRTSVPCDPPPLHSTTTSDRSHARSDHVQLYQNVSRVQPTKQDSCTCSYLGCTCLEGTRLRHVVNATLEVERPRFIARNCCSPTVASDKKERMAVDPGAVPVS